jgi:hypothetical protein
MALAMTYALQSGPNKQPVMGGSIESIVYIEISWGWAAVPLATEALALVLLTLTMWRSRPSRREAIPTWKSSALALLLHDVRQPRYQNDDQKDASPLVISTRLAGKQDLKKVGIRKARFTSWNNEENDDPEHE